MNRKILKSQYYEMVRKFVSGDWDGERFEEEFYFHFANSCGEVEMSSKEFDFFSEIQQKMDFVTDVPDERERQYGYITYSDYRLWVEGQIKSYGFDDRFSKK